MVNFIGVVPFGGEEPTRPRDADRDELRDAIGPYTHQLSGEVRVGGGSAGIERDSRRAENQQRLSEPFRRIDQHMIAQLRASLVELPAQRPGTARRADRHFGVLDEDVRSLAGRGRLSRKRAIALARICLACAVKIERAVTMSRPALGLAQTVLSQNKRANARLARKFLRILQPM